VSIRVMSRVWADDGFHNKSELLVVLAIADFANDDGLAWPSIDTLAKKSRCCQRSVQTIIARLVRLQKLDVQYGKGPHGTNLYRLIGGGVQTLHPRKRSSAKCTRPPAGTRTLICTQSVSIRHSTVRNPPISPKWERGGFRFRSGAKPALEAIEGRQARTSRKPKVPIRFRGGGQRTDLERQDCTHAVPKACHRGEEN
jgi:hypothetical protein